MRLVCGFAAGLVGLGLADDEFRAVGDPRGDCDLIVNSKFRANAHVIERQEIKPIGARVVQLVLRIITLNSERTGQMQIWRMKPDGTAQEQITSDEFNNWFPHPSPDGKWLVFLSYGKEVSGHPENKDVTLRLMSLPDKKITILAKLFGGQGTINVPSWSPDSKKLAFVSYQLLPPRD